MLNAYFGHHKCGTRWIVAVLGGLCRTMGLRFKDVVNPALSGADLASMIETEGIDFLSHTNANPKCLTGLPEFRGVHVVRDPRDIVVSGYFSHRNSHTTEGWPELVAHRERLKALPEDEGLLAEIEWAPTVANFERMGDWDYGQPHILEVKMEDLTPEPAAGFIRILRHLDLLADRSSPMDPLRRPMRKLLGAAGRRLGGRSWIAYRPATELEVHGQLEVLSFERLAAGRKPGQEDTNSHYRKGVAGDWVNHFTDRHKRAFKDRYGTLLQTLGYAENSDW